MAKDIKLPDEIRKVAIESTRQIEPFNEEARHLSILNKPLWLHQRDVLDTVFKGRCREGASVPSLETIPLEGQQHPALVHRDELFFDQAYLEAFWEQAGQRDRPCQAGFSADDRAYLTYSLPLTQHFVKDVDDLGRPIYRVPLWYFPPGLTAEGRAAQPEPIVIQSDYRELGYYSVPEYMSTELGDLVHLLPSRSMLSIESWVHIYYANVIFGVFAAGSRYEERANRDWLLRLKIMLRAMLEQTQMLSCSEMVKVGRNCQIDPSAVLQGRVEIGDNVVIEAGSVVVNSMIGSNTTLGQGCQVFLSVVGEGCFIPFRASMFMSVFMEKSIVAQNTCLQMAVVGRHSFVGAGNTFTDFLLVPKRDESLLAMGPDGLESTGQIVLGGCVGHNCRIGSGMIVYPARMIESDTILIASPSRNVIMRNVSYEESDHHTFARADAHSRQYPRHDEEEEVEAEW